jgi:ASPIC and UnbV.
MAVGDLDNDGRLDAVVTVNGGAPHVLRNMTPTQNHWLTFNLVGHKSNRDGIGAEIKVTTSHGTQWLSVSTSGSYLSSNDKRAHFGLGSDTAAKAVEIRWPSGVIQRMSQIQGDQILRVEEPDKSLSLGTTQ